MEASNPRSLLIKLVVFKKASFSILLMIISLLSAWSWRNYDLFTRWAENYIVDAEFHLVQKLLNFALNSDVHNLRLIARLTGIYGVVLGVATIGFWYRKKWAHFLFVGLVGMLLPIEVVELLHHLSPTTLVIFIINFGIFAYLLISFELTHQPITTADEQL